MSSNSKTGTITTISTKLFRLTQEYHMTCLRQLFLRYYEPSVVGDKLQPNLQWTVDVNDKVIDKLRLHLTCVGRWSVPLDGWTDREKNTKTIFYIRNNIFIILRESYKINTLCYKQTNKQINKRSKPLALVTVGR